LLSFFTCVIILHLIQKRRSHHFFFVGALLKNILRSKHGKLDQKKCLLNIPFKNITSFLHTHKKYIEKCFIFHFENSYASIGLMVNWVQNLKNFNIIKVSNRYVWNWFENIFFKPSFTLEAIYILIRMLKRWKVTSTF